MAQIDDLLKSPWVKPDDITKHGLQVEIMGEGEIVVSTFPNQTDQTRLELPVRILPSGEEKAYTPNKTSLQAIANVWGMESRKWVGKRLLLEKSKVSVNGQLKEAVYASPIDEEEDVSELLPEE